MIAKESPLQGMSAGAITSVLMHELAGLHMIDLRIAPNTSTFSAVVKALSIDLPERPGRIGSSSSSVTNEAQSLSLAPDWWLIVGFPEAEQKLLPLLLDSRHHLSVVDVSGQRTAIQLEGPRVREVLAQLWEQDLREKRFPIGSVSQGLMAKAPVIVCHIAPNCYRVLVRSSFALHLWKVLEDAIDGE